MIPGYELASNTPMKNLRAYINLTSFAAAIKATPTQQPPKVISSSVPHRTIDHILIPLPTPNLPVMTPQAISIEGKNQLGLVLVKMI